MAQAIYTLTINNKVLQLLHFSSTSILVRVCSYTAHKRSYHDDWICKYPNMLEDIAAVALASTS